MRQPDPMPDSVPWRQRLVAQLKRSRALHSPAVEAAFLAVPRELFIPAFRGAEDLEWVYEDRPLLTKHIGEAVLSTSSQPTMMATMLQLLEPLRGAAVLEIGSGTGYNCALLAHVVGAEGRVIGMELEEDLALRANETLRRLGLDGRAQVLAGNGWEGYPAAAPYDRIIVTAQSEEVAGAWYEQVVEGGRIAVPLRVESRAGSDVVIFRREGEHLIPTDHVAASFIPLKAQRRSRRRD